MDSERDDGDPVMRLEAAIQRAENAERELERFKELVRVHPRVVHLVRERGWESNSGRNLTYGFGVYLTVEEAEAAIAAARNPSNHTGFNTLTIAVGQWNKANPYNESWW